MSNIDFFLKPDKSFSKLDPKNLLLGLNISLIVDTIIFFLSGVYLHTVELLTSLFILIYGIIMRYTFGRINFSNTVYLFTYKILVYYLLIIMSIYRFGGYQSILMYYLVLIPFSFSRLEYIHFKTIILYVIPILIATFFTIFSHFKCDIPHYIQSQPLIYLFHFMIIFVLVNLLSIIDFQNINNKYDTIAQLNTIIQNLNKTLEKKLTENINLTNHIIHDSLKPFFTVIHSNDLDPELFDKLDKTYKMSHSIASTYMKSLSTHNSSNNFKTHISTVNNEMFQNFFSYKVIIEKECKNVNLLIPWIILQNIFNNLYANSIEHSKVPLTLLDIKIQIKKLPNHQRITLTYEDNGQGIPDDKTRNIFSLHLQDQEENNRFKGLGLKSIKKLLLQFGGDIYIDDELLISGYRKARFIIKLPFEDIN